MTKAQQERQELATILPVWEDGSFRLASLLDMIRFYAEKFIAVTNWLETVNAIAGTTKVGLDDVIVDKTRSMFNEEVDKAVENCSQIGLVHCVKQLERIKRSLAYPGSRMCDYIALVRELQNRIEDELESVMLMQIPVDRARYYEGQNLFGQDVADKFPSAILDIEEAGKCYAVSRHTACVFHLMRVMEIGLRSVAKSLGIPDTNILPSWQSVIDKINKQINAPNAGKSPDWKRVEPFYKGVSAQLFAVKV